MSASPHPLLGNLSAAGFLRDVWQQRPLLVRGALSGYRSPLSADELAGLSLEEAVESRLVAGSMAAGWSLEHGPIAEERYAELGEADWTLLVQAVDLWVPEVAKLIDRFDFLPRWRIDDVMVSFAAPGGSVGPHVDLYDVFLIQVEGNRRWQLGGEVGADAKLLSGVDLKILADFDVTEEWVLEPGDLLYLPPGVAHWGIAETPCMTFSVGCRSPLLADMLGDLAVELLSRGEGGPYRDPAMRPELAGGELSDAFVASAQQQLRRLLDNEAVIADWLARYMTTPKYPDLLELTDESRTLIRKGVRYRNGVVDENHR